jgi:hypothetical protein
LHEGLEAFLAEPLDRQEAQLRQPAQLRGARVRRLEQVVARDDVEAHAQPEQQHGERVDRGNGLAEGGEGKVAPPLRVALHLVSNGAHVQQPVELLEDPRQLAAHGGLALALRVFEVVAQPAGAHARTAGVSEASARNRAKARLVSFSSPDSGRSGLLSSASNSRRSRSRFCCKTW